MGPVLIAVAILGVLGGVAYLSRRTGGGEVQSVRSYHRAVGTMERFPTRGAGTAVRPDPGDDEEPGPSPAGEGSVHTVAPGSDLLPRPKVRPARLLFDDATPADLGPPTAVEARRDRRQQRHALDTMNHRPRQGGTLAAALVLVLLVAGLAYLGLHHAGPTRPAHHQATSAPSTADAPRSAHGATAGSHDGTTPRSPASSAKSTKKRATTSTTTPPPTQLVAASSTPTTGTYSVPSPTYTVTVTATRPCWVQVTAQPAGTVAWEGTIPPGQSQAVPASGRTTVEIGASGATVSVGGMPVVLPVGSVTPFTATFVPATT